MYTPENKIDYIETATEIAEWAKRNYGFFVNKNSDSNKIAQDFSNQLERLPMDAMAYIQQTKNNFIDAGNNYPPSPAIFIQELKNTFNKLNPKTKNSYVNLITIDYSGKKYINKFTKNGKLISRTSL